MPSKASKTIFLLLVLSQARCSALAFSRSPPVPIGISLLLTETGTAPLRALCRVHRPDLANPKTNWNKTPGYTEAETSAFARILNAEGEDADADAGKFVDVWRQRHPDLRHYTYFSYRFNCREKGLGWRLDMCEYQYSFAFVFAFLEPRRRAGSLYPYGVAREQPLRLCE